MSEIVKLPNTHSCPDGSFTKVVITKGFGCFVPIDGSVCKLKVLSDEDSVISDLDSDKCLEIVIGEADNEVDTVLHDCVVTMKEDEVCDVVFINTGTTYTLKEIRIKKHVSDIDELKSLSDDEKEINKDSEDLRNDKNTQESIDEEKCPNINEIDNKKEEEKLTEQTKQELKSPINQDSTFTHKMRLHLVSFTRQPEIWEMSVTEKWRRANHHKECGMELFSRGEIKWAFRRFGLALKYLISAELDIPPEELGKDLDIKGMKLSCYLNLAACHLKRHNFESVVKNCTKALELDVYSAKALYRRGTAYTHLQDYDKAKEDLDKAQELEPGNSAIVKQQQILKARVQKLNKYFANAMRKMFT